jgi:hypothetical protein
MHNYARLDVRTIALRFFHIFLLPNRDYLSSAIFAFSK